MEKKSYTTLVNNIEGDIPAVNAKKCCYKCGKDIDPSKGHFMYFGSVQVDVNSVEVMKIKYAPYCPVCSEVIADVTGAKVFDDTKTVIYNPTERK